MDKVFKIITLLAALLAVFLVTANSMADPNWNDGTFSISEYSYVFCEDQDSYYLDPGYGGQPYDVEYLGLFVTDDRVYFGLQILSYY